MEGLSVHYFRTMVEDDHLGLTPVQRSRQENVQDAFIIFGTHSRDPVRFGQHALSLGHGRSRPSKPQARVAYESATAPKRHKKDPNRPRGYISAFNFFVKDKRPTYVQSRPNAQGHSLEHNNEINKMLGKVWKTATEDEKKTYEEKATADKVRYLKEMSAYRPPEGYERIAPRINVPKGFSAVAWDPDVNGGTTAQPCRRPWPAYTHFAHQEKIGVLSSRSNRAKTLMSKAFGQRWHGMPDEETELYKELEEADKERYEKEACAQDTAASLS
ncbi:unnamed protein product [Laminaria digitata]